MDLVEATQVKDREEMATRTLSKAQVNFLLQRTPKEEVFTRPGKGGKEFTYVEIGYVIATLNQVFGFRWNFTVIEHWEEGDEVGVLGRLTATAPSGETIIKDQFGQSDIKKDRNNKVLSKVDDYKAAASDALKKCASLLGVAGDVYGRERQMFEDASGAPGAPDPEDRRSGLGGPIPMRVIGPPGGERSVEVSDLPSKGTDMWGNFMAAVIDKLQELGCADQLIARLTNAIKLNMEIRGTTHDHDALRVVYTAIKEWQTSGSAVQMLNELTTTNKRLRDEAKALEAQPMRKNPELEDFFNG